MLKCKCGFFKGVGGGSQWLLGSVVLRIKQHRLLSWSGSLGNP